MTKACIYIRWSTEDQGQGTTLQVQMESCREYCDRQGWHVPDELIFVDEGYSGGTLHRPGLTKLRKLIEDGLVDAIVVYRLDRLSRNLADATGLVDKEFKHRAVVRSATEDVRPEADEGWLNYSFRAAFADYERRIIRQRTMSGRLRRLQEGRKVHGGAPYGWRHTSKPGVLEHDPDQIEVVRELFNRCAYQNTGAPTLSRWLNTEGIPSPEGAKWHQSVVRRMLQNPIYGGRIVFGMKKYLKRSKEDPGPWSQSASPVVDVEADQQAVPPIVSRELWELAQRSIELRTEMPTRGRGTSNPHLLSGFLYCRCGSRMGPKTAGQKKRTFGLVYYRCYREAEVERCHIDTGYLEASLLEADIETALLEHLNSDDIRTGLARRVKDRLGDETALLVSRQRQLQQEAAQVATDLQFIDKQFRRQQITIEEARRIRAGIDGELASLQTQLDEVEHKLGQSGTAKTDYALLMAQLDLAERWEVLTVVERKQVMRHFVDRIEAYRPRTGGQAEVTITWKFGPASEHHVAQPVRRRTEA